MAPLPAPLEHFEKRCVRYVAPAGVRSPQHDREVEYGVLVSSHFDAERWEEGADDSMNTALVVTLPLGATAEMIGLWTDLLDETAPGGQQACEVRGTRGRCQMKIVCVNRPGIGATTGAGDDLTDVMNTILEDIDRALEQERVGRFHVMGMCLGAMVVPALVRRHLAWPSDSPPSRPRLLFPVFFNGPWSSVENPHTLGIARLGASALVPSLFVTCGIGLGASLTCLGLWSISSMPNSLSMQLSRREKAAYTEEDFQRGGCIFSAVIESARGGDVSGQMRLALAGRELSYAESLKRMVAEAARLLREAPGRGGPDEALKVAAEIPGSPEARGEGAPLLPEAAAATELADSSLLFKIYSGGDKDGMTSPAAVDWLRDTLRDAAREANLDPETAVQADRFEDAGHGGILCGHGPMRNPLIYRDILLKCGL